MSIDGYGTTLSCSDGGGTTSFGRITNIDLSPGDRDDIEIYAMDSTDKIKEFIPGGLDLGSVSVTMMYDGSATGAAGALDALKTANAATWTLTLNDHTSAGSRSKLVFPGYCKPLGLAIPNGDKVTQTVTIKVTGKWTYTPRA